MIEKIIITAILAWIGLAFGNFFFQMIVNIKDWEKAVERSFFQLIAIGWVTFLIWGIL